jgi:hypothetical protein
LDNLVTATPLRVVTVLEKWVMHCRLFHLLRAELQQQLLQVQTTRVHC